MAMRRSNGAHIWKSEAGASVRKQGRRAAAGEVIERVLHDQSPVSCFMTHSEYIIHWYMLKSNVIWVA